MRGPLSAIDQKLLHSHTNFTMINEGEFIYKLSYSIVHYEHGFLSKKRPPFQSFWPVRNFRSETEKIPLNKVEFSFLPVID